ncbi:DUF6247 family protein [Streptomyces sp. CA-210063]|uniref:DUF6247 family protein n=1 Tax=Streptomyces sp. CA-210063 TaxID=2801029 RepID=UPI00214B1D6E|nr:DUF6247 family protein [Streptomyces sp. CA-210063]UUU28582.1 DUF6247 family protein [Streptomyces sp. CA-210063]
MAGVRPPLTVGPVPLQPRGRRRDRPSDCARRRCAFEQDWARALDDARHSYSLAPVHDVVRTWRSRLGAGLRGPYVGDQPSWVTRAGVVAWSFWALYLPGAV